MVDKEINHLILNRSHIPVMLEEVKLYLNIKEGHTYVDGTFGAGGHSHMILSSANCKLFAIDRDPNTQRYAKVIKNKYCNNFKLMEGQISNLKMLLKNNGIKKIDGGILFDLGISSMQVDNANRGFSFNKDGPLDMRMGLKGQTAAQIIDESDEKTLSDIIYNYGEEHHSRRIAKAIVNYKKNKVIKTTLELAEIVRSAIGNKSNNKIDPATKTFQAFRIKVNNELEEIKNALNVARDILAPGARLVVISFHSLEDKIVKTFFKTNSGLNDNPYRHSLDVYKNKNKKPEFTILTKKVVKASLEEVKVNFRARSAKLRAVEKINNFAEAA